jgi:hypothetical protein
MGISSNVDVVHQAGLGGPHGIDMLRTCSTLRLGQAAHLRLVLVLLVLADVRIASFIAASDQSRWVFLTTIRPVMCGAAMEVPNKTWNRYDYCFVDPGGSMADP